MTITTSKIVRFARIYPLTLLPFFLIACATSPEKQFYKLCPDCQIQTTNNHSTPLKVITRFPNAKNTSNLKYLHVYLEGDGIPYTHADVVSNNPNSVNLTAFKLMLLDSNPSIYITRPCYGFDIMPANCTPFYWTSGRYSQKVVDLLNHQLDRIKNSLGIENFVLIGHSGGGTLAYLLAQHRKDVATLITIAANLDHKAWSKELNIIPLSDSLNPVDKTPLDEQIQQWHLVGERDRVVPPKYTRAISKTDPNARILSYDVDHACCWSSIWEEILKRVTRNIF